MRNRLVTPLPVVGLIQIYVLSQQLPDLVAQQSYADMILKNGKVVSMDDRTITLNTPGNVYQARAIKRAYRRVPSDQSARYCSDRSRSGLRNRHPGILPAFWELVRPCRGRTALRPYCSLLDIAPKELLSQSSLSLGGKYLAILDRGGQPLPIQIPGSTIQLLEPIPAETTL